MRKKTILENSRGSILVGAVAMATIMAMAGAGFLLVTVNGINTETAALENEKAFVAAESGVWIAARWLRSNLYSMSSGATTPNFINTPIPLNGMNVYVTVTVDAATSVATIKSEVYKGDKTAAAFKKRLRVDNIQGQNFGAFSTFYGGYQPMDCDAANWDGTNWKNTWGGWKSIVSYNGRMHLNNMPIKIFDQPGPKFTGLVTVARGNGQSNYGIGHNGNNYNSGITGYGNGSGSLDSILLDNVFLDRYIPNVEPIALNVGDTSANSLLANNAIPNSHKIVLPASVRDDGYGPYQYRPTLHFDADGVTAHYQYKRDATSYHDSIITNFDGKLFLCPNNLNVYSTGNGVKGKITIATTSGKSIVPVGNLIVDGYDIATGAITNPSANNNMIGLISGAYVAFNKTWIKRFAGSPTDNTQYVSSQTYPIGLPPGTFNFDTAAAHTLHMTAAIMAVCHFPDTRYNGAAWQTFPMSGTELWDGMWGQDIRNPVYQPPHPLAWQPKPFTDPENMSEDYSFQLYGNHILASYARSIYGPICNPKRPARGCAGTITFNHDPRMYQRNLQPPGFPGVSNGNGLLTLRLRNWSEEDSYN